MVSDTMAMRTASFAQDSNTLFYGGDSKIGHFFDGSASPHPSIMSVTFSNEIMTSDFCEDGERLLIGTSNG